MIIESLEIKNYGSIEHFEAKFHEGYNYLPVNDEVFEVINYIMRTFDLSVYDFDKFTEKTLVCAILSENEYRFQVELVHDSQRYSPVSHIQINDLMILPGNLLYHEFLDCIYPQDFAEFATFHQNNRNRHVNYVAEKYRDLANGTKYAVEELLIAGKLPCETNLMTYSDRTQGILSSYGMLNVLIEHLNKLVPVKFGTDSYQCELKYDGFYLSNNDNPIDEKELDENSALLYDLVRYCMTLDVVATMRIHNVRRANFPVAIVDVNSFVDNQIVQQLIKNRQVFVFTNNATMLNSEHAVEYDEVDRQHQDVHINAPEKENLKELCTQALRCSLGKDNGRISFVTIQRNLGISFHHAGEIWDELQKLKCVEPMSGDTRPNAPHRVTVALEELDSLFPY